MNHQIITPPNVENALTTPETKPHVNAAFAYLSTLHSKSSRITMKSKLHHVAELIGCQSIADVDWDEMLPEQVLALMVKLETEGKKGSTINSYLSALKGVAHASWLAQQMDHERLLRIQAIKQVRYHRLPTGRSISFRESAQLLKAFDVRTPGGARDHAAAALFLGCGIRRSECAEALMENYNDYEKSLRIVGKGNKERIVYLPNETAEALDYWIRRFRGTDKGPLICRIFKGGHVAPGKGIDPRTIGTIMKEYMEKVMDEDPTTMHLHFSTHDFRRTFATRLLSDNVDIVSVQKMMGHASVTTTAQYDRRADEERKRIAQKIKL